MADPVPARFDIFISHSRADQDWVDTQLLPRLENAGLRVAVGYRDFVPGMPLLENIERAVQDSRHTLAILTPAWLASEWNAFESLLVRTLDPAARRRKLIPLLLKPCDLPEPLAALDAVDLTAERYWETSIRKLTRSLEDTLPAPRPPLPRPGQRNAPDLARQWRRWLRRYRRRVAWGLVAAMGGILLLLMLVQAPPFQPRLGWQVLGPRFDQAWQLDRAGDVLLVSSATDFEPRCRPVDSQALWRSTDQGASWAPIDVPALRVELLDRQCDTAAFADFAHSPAAPSRIYGATWEAGLLRSDDGGATWQRVGADDLPPRLYRVAVDPAQPDWVLAAPLGAGLYRSTDGGQAWQRLDGQDTCPNAAQGGALPAGLMVGALRFAPGAVYAGSGRADDLNTMPGPADGLYQSRDGGACWRRIDDAQGRYKYRFVVENPAVDGEVLALVYDARAVTGEPQDPLWLVSDTRGRSNPIWQANSIPQALEFGQHAPFMWYLADDKGVVTSGLPDGSRQQRTSLLLSCILDRQRPNSCWTDLAPDSEADFPLLLANNRVYRRGMVPWYRAIWPPD